MSKTIAEQISELEAEKQLLKAQIKTIKVEAYKFYKKIEAEYEAIINQANIESNQASAILLQSVNHQRIEISSIEQRLQEKLQEESFQEDPEYAELYLQYNVLQAAVSAQAKGTLETILFFHEKKINSIMKQKQSTIEQAEKEKEKAITPLQNQITEISTKQKHLKEEEIDKIATNLAKLTIETVAKEENARLEQARIAAEAEQTRIAAEAEQTRIAAEAEQTRIAAEAEKQRQKKLKKQTTKAAMTATRKTETAKKQEALFEQAIQEAKEYKAKITQIVTEEIQAQTKREMSAITNAISSKMVNSLIETAKIIALEHPIFEAIKTENIEQIRQILSSQINLKEIYNREGNNPFIYGCTINSPREILGLLLSADPDLINHPKKIGFFQEAEIYKVDELTPIQVAFPTISLNTLEFLGEQDNINLNIIYRDTGNSLLEYAIESSLSPQIIDKFLEIYYNSTIKYLKKNTRMEEWLEAVLIRYRTATLEELSQSEAQLDQSLAIILKNLPEGLVVDDVSVREQIEAHIKSEVLKARVREEVNEAILKHININNDTAVHLAIKRGSIEVLDILRKYGISFENCPSDNKSTPPLFLAAAMGNEEVFSYIYDNITNKNLTATFGTTEIMGVSLPTNINLFQRAVKGGNINIVKRVWKELESKKGDIDLRREKSITGGTAMHFACMNGAPLEVLQFLLEKDFSANEADNRGVTPLIALCRTSAPTENTLKCVQALIKKKVSINAPDKDQISALLHVCQHESNFNRKEASTKPYPNEAEAVKAKLARLLINQGANINAIDPNSLPAIALTIKDQLTAVTKELLKEKTLNLNVQYKIKVVYRRSDVLSQEAMPVYAIEHLIIESDDAQLFEEFYNKTTDPKAKIYLTHIAAKFGKLNILGCLIEKGVTIVADIEGKNPIHHAILNNQLESLNVLLRALPSTKVLELLNQKNKDGKYPLDLAIEENDLEMVRQLIKAGAKVNYIIPGENGYTPLHLAIANSNLELVKILVEEGKADVNAKVNSGNISPAFFLALKYGKKEIIEYLMSRSIDLNLTDKRGSNALQYAAYYATDTEIIQKIINSGKIDINYKDKIGISAFGTAYFNLQSYLNEDMDLEVIQDRIVQVKLKRALTSEETKQKNLLEVVNFILKQPEFKCSLEELAQMRQNIKRSNEESQTTPITAQCLSQVLSAAVSQMGASQDSQELKFITDLITCSSTHLARVTASKVRSGQGRKR